MYVLIDKDTKRALVYSATKLEVKEGQQCVEVDAEFGPEVAVFENGQLVEVTQDDLDRRETLKLWRRLKKVIVNHKDEINELLGA